MKTDIAALPPVAAPDNCFRASRASDESYRNVRFPPNADIGRWLDDVLDSPPPWNAVTCRSVKKGENVMHRIILIAAIAALAACSKQAAPPADDVNVTAANEVAAAPVPAAFSINETSWEFTEDGKPMQGSIDASGNYITTSGTEHIDHGTAVMKDGNVCFTSAMTKEGEVCWTDPRLEVGASGETVSDKGEKLPIKRIAYIAKTM